GQIFINTTGNSSLAKGGTGDVLTGMILSMVSYYEDIYQAVINAVYIHGLAAELWSESYSKCGMTASDFHYLLPEVMKKLEVKQTIPNLINKFGIVLMCCIIFLVDRLYLVNERQRLLHNGYSFCFLNHRLLLLFDAK